MNAARQSDGPPTGSRRNFLKSSAGVLAGTVAAPLIAPAFVHAAGSDLLRVGLVGCGGRGAGAASQALRGDPHVQLTAMADALPHHLERSLRALAQDEKIVSKNDVPPHRPFLGFVTYPPLL